MRKTRILVVDDDEKALNLIEAMLTPNGYDVILISEGKKTIDAARNQKPDLILLDVMMPDPSGYTVLSAIKADGDIKDIPVIMVTALTYELNEMFARDLGAAGYITKPIDLQNLLGTISGILPGS